CVSSWSCHDILKPPRAAAPRLPTAAGSSSRRIRARDKLPNERRVPPSLSRRRSGAEPDEAGLRLADKFDGCRLSSLGGQQKSRYEGSQIGKSIGSGFEHYDGNRE